MSKLLEITIVLVFHLFRITLSVTKLYQRHPSTSHIDCGRILNGEELYIKDDRNRATYKDEPNLTVDCQTIRQRHYFPEQPASDEEAKFPIAYARAIFKDYLLIEMEYCYAVSAKADVLYKARINNLTNCFPNVFVNEVEFETNSAGHNMSFAMLECMKNLLRTDRRWEYNHDISAKTNQELVQIFQWMGGANDMEIEKLKQMNRVDWKMDWTFKGLNIFLNDSLKKEARNNSDSKMRFSKGYSEMSLTRTSVDYMLNQLNLTTFLTQLNGPAYGVDEVAFQTIATTEALHLPGGLLRIA
uniref:Uncharacterized protein n=1 Tax=Ditylenchus dipsaci TaxID=166011 RepID=A0A915DE87_9BILA